jgi:transcriptional regulator with XRE-family HTH domain
MVLDFLSKLTEPMGNMPNRFTLGMGELIRQARHDSGFSQARLARLINRRQASLSDMENGKMQPDAETLLMLSLVLRKPIIQFFPAGELEDLVDLENLNPTLQELLLNAMRLSEDDLQILIVQTKALVNRSK